jgi:dihydrofolate reductase
MQISLIVAAAENDVIGRAGRLPWRLPADLRHFKQLTMGHHLIMGRKTFESIGRPLPGRTSIVLSRRQDFPAPEVLLAGSLDEALRRAGGDGEVFIVGGADVYRQALPLADRIYLTRVHADIAGDTYFPALPPGQWVLRESRRQAADAKNEYDYSFLLYERHG